MDGLVFHWPAVDCSKCCGVMTAIETTFILVSLVSNSELVTHGDMNEGIDEAGELTATFA